MELKNKTAVVSGASRGIGREIVMALSREGCNIVACARSRDLLAELKKEAEVNGVSIEAVAADLRKLSEIKKVIETAVKSFGTIDILINNAGVIANDGIFGVTESDWDMTMDVNLKAQFFLAQGALAVMKEKKEGYIVNISSTVAFGAKPDVTSYSISKYGVMGMSQALYQEAKQYSVKVSTVYPGVTDTEMLRGQNMPCGPEKWMRPQDIADCVLFLLKTNSRMIIKDIVPWSTGYDQI